MTNTNTEWEKRFDDDYELGGGFRDLQIMLRGRKGIEKGFAAHIRLIKDFIRTEKEKSYQEGVAARSLQIKQWIQNIEKVDAHDDDDASVLEDSHVIKMARSSYDELITALTPQDV